MCVGVRARARVGVSAVERSKDLQLEALLPHLITDGVEQTL